MKSAVEAKAAIEAAYRARTPRSETLHREAQDLLPGGVVRSITRLAPYPTYLTEGCGCRVTDVDGNTYIDHLNNYGSMIHGHAHPVVVAAMQAQVARGTDFGTPTELQLRLARVIRDRVPSVERIRFTNSGSEAVMYAVRAARAFTGRSRILKMEGSYHGGSDTVVVSPGLVTAAGHVLIASFNDVDVASRLIREHAGDLAAVLVEPVSVRGMIAADPLYLRCLRDVTREAGVPLIVDEVVTFRLATGGAQQHFGITADLTTFGKIIGGGLPVGAFGGRADIMERFNPSRPDAVQHSGTFAGNAATVAAGLAALELLTPAAIAQLNALGDRLRARLQAEFSAANVAARVTGFGSLIGIHLTAEPVRNHRDSLRADGDAMHWLHLAALNHGLFMRAEGAFFLSTAVGETDVEETMSAFRQALADAKPILPAGYQS